MQCPLLAGHSGVVEQRSVEYDIVEDVVVLLVVVLLLVVVVVVVLLFVVVDVVVVVVVLLLGPLPPRRCCWFPRSSPPPVVLFLEESQRISSCALAVHTILGASYLPTWLVFPSDSWFAVSPVRSVVV